jgi:hypothetical protein
MRQLLSEKKETDAKLLQAMEIENGHSPYEFSEKFRIKLFVVMVFVWFSDLAISL